MAPRRAGGVGGGGGGRGGYAQRRYAAEEMEPPTKKHKHARLLKTATPGGDVAVKVAAAAGRGAGAQANADAGAAAAAAAAPEEQILELCRRYPDGLRDATMETELSMSLETRAVALNALLASHRLCVYQQGESGALVYKERKVEEAAKLQGLGSEERLVLQLVEEAKNHGVWSKELKQKSNLTNAVVQKALKALETRNIIKNVKSVGQKNRKVYMLFELEPSREVTGGAFYNNDGNELDNELIDALRKVVEHFIREHDEVSLVDVIMFVEQTAVIKDLSLCADEYLSICNTLMFDGIVDKRKDKAIGQAFAEADARAARRGNGKSNGRIKASLMEWGNEKREQEVAEDIRVNLSGEERDSVFKLVAYHIPVETALTSTPCGMCPVMEECRPKGPVSPETCVYFEMW